LVAYHDCRTMSYTPYYIILGEFGYAIADSITDGLYPR
jgi:hypothetical protein